jgi:hypothetical protein
MSNPLVFIIAALFLAAAVSNSLGPERDFAKAAGGYAVGACLIATWWFMRGHARYQANFLNDRSKSRESQAPRITASAMTTGRRRTARSGRANPTACP